MRVMPRIVNVPYESLRQLYLLEGKSSRKIAKIFGCAYSTIDNKIRKYGFPIKTLAASHIKSFRAPFSGNLAEKAYLIGFRIGDLRVRKFYKNSETLKIDCGSTRMDQIDHIKSLFEPYGKIWISKPSKENKTQIECSVDFSFDFLLEKYSVFPDFIAKKKNLFMSALAGFIDAEGHFGVSSDNKKAVFSLGNYNLPLLKQISSYLSFIRHKLILGVKKGYKGKDGYVHRGDYWMLVINRKWDLYKFVELIKPYLLYDRKIADTERVLINIRERNDKFGKIGFYEK